MNYVARAWLAVAGLAFGAFPLVRPWGDKSGASTGMAVAFADPLWVVAHSASVFGFVALALTLRSWGHRRLELTAWIGAALVLPFYGAETFGLHAIGTTVLPTGDLGMLTAAEAFRSDVVALVPFALGLVAVAVVGVGMAVTTWRGGLLERIAGIITAAGLVAHFPQFMLSAEGA